MSPQELDRALAKLGMTQSGAARYFGLGARTMRSYIAGDLPVPVMLVLALTALIVSRIEPAELRRRAGLEPVDFSPGRLAHNDDGLNNWRQKQDRWSLQ